jgi:hypothetical protein
MRVQGEPTPHGKPHAVGWREAQLEAREGQARRYGGGGEARSSEQAG